MPENERGGTPVNRPRLLVEPTFDRCVAEAGGKRLEDYISGELRFLNADYIFPDDNIVAELKVLEKDVLSTPDFQDKISELYDGWAQSGLVPPAYSPGSIDTSTLPTECAVELIGLFKSQLTNSYIKKANRQIRETKEHLELPDARGVLLLANDGNFAFDPAFMFNVLHHSLHKTFHSIDAVIYFTANLMVTTPRSPNGALFWAHVAIQGRPKIEAAFESRLRSSWLSVVESETGRRPTELVEDKLTPEIIDQMRFKSP